MNDKAVNLRVTPFAMLDVLAAEIRVAPNEHAAAHVRGTIVNEREAEYLSLMQADVFVTIEQYGEGQGSCVLFSGIVDDAEIFTENGVKILDLRLVSGTRLMDMVEHTRTYQTASLTYNDLLASLGDYPDYYFSMRAGDGRQIGDLVAQFKETDWEFAKRLASHFNAPLYPDYAGGSVGYFVGIPGLSGMVADEPSHYRVVKGVGEYLNKSRNKVEGVSENDEIVYIVRSRNIYRIGQNVTVKDKVLRVFEINSVLVGQLMENYYTLKPEAGFKVRETFNFKAVGASLPCTVTDVKQDVIKAHIHADSDSYATGAKWFSFSTTYSSPDGTGWYAMPEPGDELRLYFPSEHESEAYTISAVNADSPDMGKDVPPPEAGILPFVQPRTVPDVKTFINKYLKEVSLYPDKIAITNNNDMMITVDDNEGITIQSAKKIVFKSGESISAASSQADLRAIGSSSVHIEVGGTKVVLTKDLTFEGGSLYIQ